MSAMSKLACTCRGSAVLTEFLDPSPYYSIYPLLHGLCNLAGKKGKLDEKIDELQRRGFGGVVTNPGWGPDYLEEWTPFKKVIAALEKADFAIYLYDEKGYPSGSAGGRVLEEHPEAETAGMMAYRFPRLLRGAGTYRADVPDGTLHRVYLLPAATDAENTPVDIDGRLDVTRCVDRRGTLRISIPAGKWVLLMLFVRTQYDDTHSMLSYSEPRRYINLLDRKAGQCFVDVTHERFFKAVGKSFGRSIRAIFTDEPSLQPPLDNKWPYTVLPWHTSLPRAFRRKYGRNMDEAILAAAISDAGPRSASLRCDFWELIAERCSDGFFGPIEKWCVKRGIQATGHLLWEEGLARHVGFEGSYFAAMRRFHVPGIDMLSSRPENLVERCMTPKLASSVAHLMGRPEVMSEASDHEERVGGKRPVTIEEIKASMNWHYALGVNVITSYYGFDRFTDAEVRDINMYVRRLGSVLRCGAHVAPVAMLYPEQSLWAATIRGMQAKDAAWLEKNFTAATGSLLAVQADFDYLDEKAMRASRSESGILKTGRRSYKLLVLPSVSTVDRKLIRSILGFAKAGGRIIAIEPLPFRLRGSPADKSVAAAFAALVRRGKVLPVADGGKAFERIVAESSVAEVTAEPRSRALLVHHRRLPGCEIFFVANMARKAFEGRLTFDAGGRCTVLDPAAGRFRRVSTFVSGRGKSAVRAAIPGLGAAFYVFEK
ncbi:MAG: hypothetical protein C0404_11515 [Verrucomicrobia bacterium]|nr:hypothetical protein [Verrucomicrobiota bacterium]